MKNYWNNRSRIVLIVLGLALGAVVLAACTAPQAHVRQLDLRSLTFQALEMGLIMDLRNPNSFEIPLDQMDWGVALFGRQLAEGVATPNARIPAQGRERIDVPIRIGLVDLGDAVRPILESPQIPWKVQGTCHFGTPAGPISVDFAEAGEWDNPLLRR